VNPWLSWVAPAAAAGRAQRKAVGKDDPARKVEAAMSEVMSASLDHYRAMRDAASEAAFFSTYGNMFSLYIADKQASAAHAPAGTGDPREQPYVKEALASIREGGYAEAFARVAYLLMRKDGALPLSRVVMRQELAKDYADALPALSLEQWRRVRGEQEIIASYEPEKAIETLPDLVPGREDRERLLKLMDRLLADKRVQNSKPTAEQMAMLERVRGVLGARPAGGRRLAAA